MEFHYFLLSCLLAEVNVLVRLFEGKLQKKKNQAVHSFFFFFFFLFWNITVTEDQILAMGLTLNFNHPPRLSDLFFIYLRVTGSLTFGVIPLLTCTSSVLVLNTDPSVSH